MINTNLVQINEQAVRELEISCFLEENRETGLFITIDGAVKTNIHINSNYNFEVENNKIYIENIDENTFELDMNNFLEFKDYYTCLEFTSKNGDLKIIISEF